MLPVIFLCVHLLSNSSIILSSYCLTSSFIKLCHVSFIKPCTLCHKSMLLFLAFSIFNTLAAHTGQQHLSGCLQEFEEYRVFSFFFFLPPPLHTHTHTQTRTHLKPSPVRCHRPCCCYAWGSDRSKRSRLQKGFFFLILFLFDWLCLDIFVHWFLFFPLCSTIVRYNRLPIQR